MSSSLRRGTLAAAALAFSIASLAACGAGNNAQTLEVKPDNAETSVGDIRIQNATVITQPDLKSTGPAVVTATLFNNGSKAQTLDSVVLDGVGQKAELSAADGKKSVTIPAGGSLVLGGEGNASAQLPNSRTADLDGDVRALTFTFSTTGAVKIQSFVVPAESYFKKWGPSEIPAVPSTEPSESASGSATPSGEATPSGSVSPSESASGSPAAGH
ncbi:MULTISPECIES: DUF461 domain-containing protein [unclassified Streptomyces]|uniref:DUF461 domain-containing protein n=1 Tax=unclassified Streptomyces TaxID=2593676 RepID=UPI002253BCF9|nr:MULTISPECIES: DUF461 domain-containing protein [unclassified Streptomyces]MCX5438126.1 copper chaperone PCu(A)C [Streptomyces sp. NBC_00063]WSE15776.1 copper chaperone PCu(A)C [Streptomyces sp. NBC_01397]WUB95316.1 copper chaperone PCu(A)C [Streptomyces sp. NBC_00569]